MSYVTVLSVDVETVLVLPARIAHAAGRDVGMTVPLPVAVIATVYGRRVDLRDRLDRAAGRRPSDVTSAATKAATGSLKTAVKLIGTVFVGSAWPAAWLIVTLGFTVSTVNVFAELKPVLPAVSSCSAFAVYVPSARVADETL